MREVAQPGHPSVRKDDLRVRFLHIRVFFRWIRSTYHKNHEDPNGLKKNDGLGRPNVQNLIRYLSEASFLQRRGFAGMLLRRIGLILFPHHLVSQDLFDQHYGIGQLFERLTLIVGVVCLIGETFFPGYLPLPGFASDITLAGFILLIVGLMLPIFRTPGRSISVRHLDAGSAGGSDMELAAIEQPFYDAQRYGITIEASPRHADVIALTGVMTRGMEPIILNTLVASPGARVLLIGQDAIDGGIFRDSFALMDRKDPPEVLRMILSETAPQADAPSAPASANQFIALRQWPPSPRDIIDAIKHMAQSRSERERIDGQRVDLWRTLHPNLDSSNRADNSI